MSAAKLLSSAAGAGSDKLYVDDVFSTYLYTGNGSTQTINNGIDLAGKGGLVWVKNRSRNPSSHYLADSVRGFNRYLAGSDNTLPESTTTQPIIPSSNGYSITTSGFLNNALNETYVSWTFRKAPKFFDVVTYTGDGVAGRQIPHSLGCEVGMLIIKRTDTSAINMDWVVWHRSIPNDGLILNSTQAMIAGAASAWFPNGVSSSMFSIGADSSRTNTIGATYVAYLFAHDPSPDGIIQCGSFTTDASGNATVNLGFEPQYVLHKIVNYSADWNAHDTMRGMVSSDTGTVVLRPNVTDAEFSYNQIRPTSTGFNAVGIGGGGANYQTIYLAIRRPNKPPTSGTQVFDHVARTGTGAALSLATPFPVDVQWHLWRDGGVIGAGEVYDRLRGNRKNLSFGTGAENAAYGDTNPQVDLVGVLQNGVYYPGIDWNNSGKLIYNAHFRRAPGFMDVVCYTGTGVARTVSHNLGVVPELMIVKARGAATGAPNWGVYVSSIGVTNNLWLNLTNATGAFGNVYWNSTAPTSSVFSLGTNVTVNESGVTYVTYLFSTLQGISKVGSYTGNGTSQTINCGFTTGARFVLVKRTDSTGDWYVWDTARGIVSANDPHLSLNTTAAEVTTDDSVDPDASGFIVNQNTATNINVSGGSYIFLAIA